MTSLEMAKKAAEILDTKKAAEIGVLEIKELSTLGDYFVVASATSTTQVKALADEIEFQFSQLKMEPKRIEGHQSALWILMDYYDVIIHIFTTETREFYSLERLWADAPKVDLSQILKAD